MKVKLIPYTIIIIHDNRLKKSMLVVKLSSPYCHQKLALNLLQGWHFECKLGTGCLALEQQIWDGLHQSSEFLPALNNNNLELDPKF